MASNNSIIKKRIGIDARFYGPLGKGLGRYTQEIVDNILLIDKENEYIIFLSPDNFDELVIAPEDSSRVKKIIIKARWYTLKEQLTLPRIIIREHLDLIHFPHFNVPLVVPTKFVVTIHDLILTKFPTVRATTLHPFLYKAKNLAYRLVIWTALKRSQKIITVSEFTKNDIIDKFHIRPDKIIVTYEGVANLAKGNDSLFVKKLDDQETLSHYHIKDNFLLYVGNAYPHKNLEGLIKVFEKLHQDQSEIRLVLVGKDDYFYSRVKDFAKNLKLYEPDNLDSPVVFPGYVPDRELEILFKRAVAYVFPSFYEGFGLPPLEAMAKGCAVISSNQSSLPEILDSAAYYFNPQDEADMLTKIKEVVGNENLRQALIARGLEQAKKYNWWDCAAQTLAVYKEVIYGNQKA
jgi:glycosyltransferase involved in cell wall biosynthesis